jgi:hypothetical protein
MFHEGNLAMRLLTYDHLNWPSNEGKHLTGIPLFFDKIYGFYSELFFLFLGYITSK